MGSTDAQREQLRADLNSAYAASVEERAAENVQPWKARVRQAFLQRLLAAGCRRLLDVGAGAGTHSLFFAHAGLAVTAADPSPEMVAHCRTQGVHAFQFTPGELAVDEPFDAAFALNSLLHVPPDELDGALRSIAACLRPGGLFFWGQYGGLEHAGPLDNDHYVPKRFFSLRSDEALRAAGRQHFEELHFEVVTMSQPWHGHFQHSVWQRA